MRGRPWCPAAAIFGAVAHPMLSRMAERARRSLGTSELRRQLQQLTERFDALQATVQTIAPAAVSSAVASRPRTVYLGDHTALVATVDGPMLLVDTRDSVVAPTLLLHGMWESTVTAWLRDALHPGQVFVDVGANVGYYSLLGASLVGPDGHVVGVEAHPHLAELLRRNVVLNDVRNVSAFHLAAWSGPDQLRFHLRTHFAANSSVGSLGAEGLRGLDDTEQQVVVPAAALDDLLGGVPQLASRGVDAVKVDVEGAELRVFHGLRRTIEGSPDITVLLEWSPGQLQMVGDSPGELVELLQGFGFGFRLVEDNLAPVDAARLLSVPYGNVVASRR